MISSVVSFVTPVKIHVLNSSQGGLNSSQDNNKSVNLDLSGYQTSPATTPVGRNNKAGWYSIHEQHQSMCKRPINYECILCGDSIIAGLSRYPRIWRTFFEPLKALSIGIGGDRTQHVLWRAEHLEIPKSTKFVVLHCGTNNIDLDSASCIANGILSIAVTFQKQISDLNVLVTGLLPRDQTETYRREKIRKVNKILKKMCRTKFEGIHYMKQDEDWVLEGGLIDETLYYTDHLNLTKKGNEKFATSITKALEKLKEDGKLDYSSGKKSDISEDEIDYCPQVSRRRNKRFRRSDFEDYGYYRYSSSSSSRRSSKHRRHTSSPRRSKSPPRKSRSRSKGVSPDVSSPDRRSRTRKSDWSTAKEASSSKLKRMKEEKRKEEQVVKMTRDDDNEDNDEDGVEKKTKVSTENDERPSPSAPSASGPSGSGPSFGTAKSIDISLDQKKRLEARRNKFAIPDPSALVKKIKASQKEARKNIKAQIQTNRKVELTNNLPKDAKLFQKFFRDYTADSDSDDDNEDVDEDGLEKMTKTPMKNYERPSASGPSATGPSGSGPFIGTAKSIDISLDQKKRLEARRNKFVIPDPSALVKKIKASQNEARKNIKAQIQTNRKVELTDNLPKGPKLLQKFFRDYTADSDSDDDNKDVDEDGVEKKTKVPTENDERPLLQILCQKMRIT